MIKDPTVKKNMFQKFIAKITPSDEKKSLPKMLAVPLEGQINLTGVPGQIINMVWTIKN